MTTENIKQIINTKKDNINKYKKQIDEIRASKIKYESQLEQLNENEAKLINDIENAGYDPNSLSDIIDTKTKELESIEEEIKAILG